jgi:hypothetical protein
MGVIFSRFRFRTTKVSLTPNVPIRTAVEKSITDQAKQSGSKELSDKELQQRVGSPLLGTPFDSFSSAMNRNVTHAQISLYEMPAVGRLPVLFSYLIVLLTVLFAAPVQSQILKDQVQIEIRRTGEIIDRAEDVIEGTGDERLINGLNRARDLQKQAEEAFNLERYLIARGMTMQARDIVRQLISQVRPLENRDGSLQGRLDRAENMLDDAADFLESSDTSLESLYDNARRNLDRAWEFFRKGELRPAIKLLEQVERAIDQIMGQGRLRDRGREHVMRRIEGVRRLIDDALAITADCNQSAAREKAIQADEQFHRATRHHGERQPILALRALQSARDLATQAIGDCDAGLDIEQLHSRMEQQRDRITEKLGTRDDQAAVAARQFLAQATAQLEDAKLQLSQKKQELAAISLKAAQLALRQAERRLGRP